MHQHSRKFGVSSEQWESKEDFLAHLGLIEFYEEEDERKLPAFRTTLAGLILFGTEDALASTHPGFETVIVTPFETKRLRINVVEAYKQLCGSPSSILPSLCPNIPLRCIRELLVNAFVHRSYRIDSPIIVHASGEALEIESPGGLSGELSTESLLYCTPVYRNFLLAEGSRYLGICDKIGKGMDEIYQNVLQQGLGFPVFENGENHFTVRVSVNRNQEFKQFLKVRAQALSQLDEIIVLRFLLDRESATFRELCSAMQRGSQFGKKVLDDMVRKAMIEPLDSLNLAWRLRSAIRNDIQHIFSEAQYELDLRSLFGE